MFKPNVLLLFKCFFHYELSTLSYEKVLFQRLGNLWADDFWAVSFSCLVLPSLQWTWEYYQPVISETYFDVKNFACNLANFFSL